MDLDSIDKVLLLICEASINQKSNSELGKALLTPISGIIKINCQLEVM